jgi:hypothetical protein
LTCVRSWSGVDPAGIAGRWGIRTSWLETHGTFILLDWSKVNTQGTLGLPHWSTVNTCAELVTHFSWSSRLRFVLSGGTLLRSFLGPKYRTFAFALPRSLSFRARTSALTVSFRASDLLSRFRLLCARKDRTGAKTGLLPVQDCQGRTARRRG